MRAEPGPESTPSGSGGVRGHKYAALLSSRAARPGYPGLAGPFLLQLPEASGARLRRFVKHSIWRFSKTMQKR